MRMTIRSSFLVWPHIRSQLLAQSANALSPHSCHKTILFYPSTTFYKSHLPVLSNCKIAPFHSNVCIFAQPKWKESSNVPHPSKLQSTSQQKVDFCSDDISKVDRLERETKTAVVKELPQDSVEDLMWKPMGSSVYLPTTMGEYTRDRLSVYLQLGKLRLSCLVVATTACGYAMGTDTLSSVPSLVTLSACCFGTFLISVAANSVNQFLEIPYDSQMQRTHSRPLVTGKVTALEAAGLSLFAGFTGLSILYMCCPSYITAVLGLTNLLLYTALYTPMKRLSHWNTWVGAVVGAIPPLMGWSAATQDILSPSAAVLFSLLYAWQFPHFMALSWNLRGDYSRAGYQMTAVVNPDLCRRVSLRYSVLMVPICLSAPLCGLTSVLFAFDSLPFNVVQVWLAWKFYKDGDSKSSRNLFRYTLIHLPVILLLMILSRPGKADDKENHIQGFRLL